MRLARSPEPPPRKHSKRPPVEARTNWDPWLPPTEAYPEVGGWLHAFALVVLTIAVFLLLAMVMMVATAW
jgi:hypothetical protein